MMEEDWIGVVHMDAPHLFIFNVQAILKTARTGLEVAAVHLMIVINSQK